MNVIHDMRYQAELRPLSYTYASKIVDYPCDSTFPIGTLGTERPAVAFVRIFDADGALTNVCMCVLAKSDLPRNYWFSRYCMHYSPGTSGNGKVRSFSSFDRQLWSISKKTSFIS